MPQVPRYQVVGPLNSSPGSRALFALCFHGSVVAPAVLLPVPRKTLDDPEALLRLRKETDRAAALDHPAILRVFGLVPHKRGLARLTAYANGESLRRLFIRAGRHTPAIAGRIVADAAMGVHYAHLAANEEGTPFVHGDLRPETLMVTYAGFTVVTGYGALTVAPTEMGGKRIPGRRKYSAPEQILGGRAAATPQTDVFLLGLVLWEALTGTVPFQDAEKPDQAIVTEALPLDSTRIPEKLRPVLERALAKKGADRFPTALAFREAVEEALAPLATREECADWVGKQFVGDPQTLAERALVVNALAEAGKSAPPAPALKAAVLPPPLPARPATPAPALVPVVPEPRRAIRSGVGGYVVLLSVVAALAAGAAGGWLARGLVQPPPERVVADDLAAPQAKPPQVMVVAPAPVPVALEQPDASPSVAVEAPDASPSVAQEEPDASRSVALAPLTHPPAEPVPAVTSPVAKDAKEPKEPKDVPARPAVASASGPDAGGPTLELFTVPEVEAFLGTKSLGHTPLTVPLPAGKQTIKLVNAGQGINVTREIEIKPTGSTSVQETIGVGSIGFQAPTGATIFLDGRRLGIAPIERRFQIYEGSHHARVQLDAQKWEEDFQIADGDWLNYTARTDPRDRGAGSGPPTTLPLLKEKSADVRPEIP